MAPLNRTDAEDVARSWVDRAAPGAEPVLHEFTRGWVISARFPPTVPYPLGVPSMVLDRASGELVIGGTLPPESIADWYERGFSPAAAEPRPAPGVGEPHPRTYPATLTQLTIGGRSWVARSLRSDTDRRIHPLVTTFFGAMPPKYKERGCERSSEAVAFSDMLLAEELARAEAGRPVMTLEDARECARGARLRTYRIREDADPTSGTPQRATLPVMLLLNYLGLDPGVASTEAD